MDARPASDNDIWRTQPSPPTPLPDQPSVGARRGESLLATGH
jgi:hypothetical protein